jgi:hypothetical protein
MKVSSALVLWSVYLLFLDFRPEGQRAGRIEGPTGVAGRVAVMLGVIQRSKTE